MEKSNVTRMLQAKNIAFTVYELTQEKLGAAETALRLQLPPNQVYKTIVVKRLGKGKTILAVVPGNCNVDLKKLAVVLKEKKLVLASHQEAEEITGLQTGGISPLALINKGFQTIIDQSAFNFNQINISGGQRGLNIQIGVKDLINLTKAGTAVISEPGQDT